MKSTMFTLTACVVMTVQGDQGEPRVSEHPLQGVPEEADMYQYGEDTQRAFLTRGFLQNILSGNGHKTTEESGDILKFPLGGATVYSNFGTHNSLALRTGIHSSKAYLADLDMVNKWNAEHGHSKATIVPDEDRVEGENGSLLLLHMDFFLFADEEDKVDPQVLQALDLFKQESSDFDDFVQTEYGLNEKTEL